MTNEEIEELIALYERGCSILQPLSVQARIRELERKLDAEVGELLGV